jgi:hypothetical protein
LGDWLGRVGGVRTMLFCRKQDLRCRRTANAYLGSSRQPVAAQRARPGLHRFRLDRPVLISVRRHRSRTAAQSLRRCLFLALTKTWRGNDLRLSRCRVLSPFQLRRFRMPESPGADGTLGQSPSSLLKLPCLCAFTCRGRYTQPVSQTHQHLGGGRVSWHHGHHVM